MLTLLELERWNALVKFDNEIRSIAERLALYGDKWIFEFARAYFALNEDRKYLSSISDRLMEEALREKARLEAEALEAKEKEWVSKFARAADGHALTEMSLAILRKADADGYKLKVERSGTIAASKGESIWYLRSNYDIERFGEIYT